MIAATETRYLNGSNRELSTTNEAELASDNANPSPSDNKSTSKLLQFSFHELKAATGNFRPDSILGEGGFGFVFKGWIEENGTAPAKPGSGITVAVKSLKVDGLQGHREWVVSRTFCFGFVKAYLPYKGDLLGSVNVKYFLGYRLRLSFLDNFTIQIL